MKIGSIGDLTKAVGGKFNLNAMLGVNMMMILGAYRFCIGNAAYQTLARRTDYNWAEQKRILGEPAMQFIGIGSDTIKLDGAIYPQFKGGLRQITLMRAQAGLGIPLMLISGNGSAFGRWCIMDISETQTVFMADGTARKITFTMTLQKYGEDALPGALGVIQKLVGAL